MTKITLTWQKDAQHDKAYNEVVEFVSLNSSSSHFTADTFSEEELDEAQFTKLEGTVIIAAIDDCIQKLSILKCMLNQPLRQSWLSLFEYKTLSERFNLNSPKKVQQFAEEEYEKIPYTNEQKRQKDVCFLIVTLQSVGEEIYHQGTYSTVVNVLLGVKQEDEDVDAIDARNHEQEHTWKALKRRLANERKNYLESLEETRIVIANLKNTIEDVEMYGIEEVRYAVDWEAARRYQHEMQLTAAEDVHTDLIALHLTKVDYENRIHGEVENFIEENSEDLRNGIGYWMQQYDEEIERRDAQIYRLKATWEQLTLNHHVLKETYENRKEFVEGWLAIKAERRRIIELERLRLWAAIKIQAWWRGVMVRRQLGPFQKKKKEKEKGKKGKK